jgi:hypothetical protein
VKTTIAAAAALTSIGLWALMWVPVTVLALLLAWALVAPSDIPVRRLERLIRAVRRPPLRGHRVLGTRPGAAEPRGDGADVPTEGATKVSDG